EHLLLGLVREGEGIAAGMLESLGPSLERVRRAVIEELGKGSSESERKSAPATGHAGSRPPFVHQAIADVEATRLQLREELGRQPTDEELGAKLDVPPDVVR